VQDSMPEGPRLMQRYMGHINVQTGVLGVAMGVCVCAQSDISVSPYSAEELVRNAHCIILVVND